ncbi:hypothetical protein, partial [Clostridium disporicum]|uniref:hypothetical protein n=1 Tax=Clostridium disporicum TaxID=84024 RepID=UPI0034A4DFD6
IKALMKEFNTIILLMLSALFLNYFPHILFRILFIIDVLVLAYKLTQLNVFLDTLEETFKNEENITNQESYLMNCRKGIIKKEHINEDEVVESEVDINTLENTNEKIEDEVKELEDTDSQKKCINDFDYIEEQQSETQEDLTKTTDTPEDKEVAQEEKIDISKYIRKLPKGKKASQKAIDLAKSYGYELKEGETFITPKK